MIHTIVSVATPPGVGGVGIVRISGKHSREILNRLFSHKQKSIESHRLVYGQFLDDSRVIDNGYAVFMKAPSSFTGEDVAEFHVHGSPLVLSRLVEAIVNTGLARLSMPGEFTRRAFENGKMSLDNAEALNMLIHSETEYQHKVAMAGTKGILSQEISEVKEKLLNMHALIEADLEYPEDETGFNPKQFLSVLDSVEGVIARLIKTYQISKSLMSGIRVAVVGVPNSGKSTLLNRLVGYERAIVTDIPGTTTDVIEVSVNLDGIKFVFVDTAGLRDSENTIESLGIQKTKDELYRADIILGLIDGTGDVCIQTDVLENLDIPDIIIVVNKGDLSSQHEGIVISAKTGMGVDNLLEKLKKRYIDIDFSEPSIFTKRQELALKDSQNAIKKIKDNPYLFKQTEILSSLVSEAVWHLDSVVGTVTSEDILDKVFSEFCLGK